MTIEAIWRKVEESCLEVDRLNGRKPAPVHQSNHLQANSPVLLPQTAQQQPEGAAKQARVQLWTSDEERERIMTAHEAWRDARIAQENAEREPIRFFLKSWFSRFRRSKLF